MHRSRWEKDLRSRFEFFEKYLAKKTYACQSLCPMTEKHSRSCGRSPSGHTHSPHQRPKKPSLYVQTTTLWDYPSQHYGNRQQGSQRYMGATPSYVIWNVIMRYTKEGDLVVDPFCGSGTTLDVAKDTKRRAQGFDLMPSRPDITAADARALPLPDATAHLLFLDPPYGDHIHYSDHEDCIGKLSAYDPNYFIAMQDALLESMRILKPEGVLALYVADFFQKKRGFVPVGFHLFRFLADTLEVLDIIAVTRHNKALLQGNHHQAAAMGNFFLRGFNYLFLAKKPAKAKAPPKGPRNR